MFKKFQVPGHTVTQSGLRKVDRTRGWLRAHKVSWPPAAAPPRPAPPPRSGRARAAAAWPINVRGMQCEVLKIVALRAPQSTILRELKATVDSTP